MRAGQVWVETVIYTLIGLTLLGLVLAFAVPKINEYRDKAVIEQTIEAFNTIDATMQDLINAGPGNVRRVDFQLKRGSLLVNATNDSLHFILDDSSVLYSEPGIPSSLGRIGILTTEGANQNVVELSVNYRADLILPENVPVAVYTHAATPYQFSLFFNNTVAGKPVVLINELSSR